MKGKCRSIEELHVRSLKKSKGATSKSSAPKRIQQGVRKGLPNNRQRTEKFFAVGTGSLGREAWGLTCKDIIA